MNEEWKPQRTGKKATVAMKIEVYVEVEESDSYHDMVEQARIQLQKRVLPSKGFYPYSMESRQIYPDVLVDELKNATIVAPVRAWQNNRK
jgi:hypothetical protein